MSAIATPMIHTTNAIVNPSPMVNPELCTYVDKFVRQESRPGVGDQQYGILFNYKDSKTGGNQTIEWMYVDDTARDADFVLVLAAISTAI